MSTPTPTSEAGPVAPAWFPDEAALTRLASTLYGELNVAPLPTDASLAETQPAVAGGLPGMTADPAATARRSFAVPRTLDPAAEVAAARTGAPVPGTTLPGTAVPGTAVPGTATSGGPGQPGGQALPSGPPQVASPAVPAFYFVTERQPAVQPAASAPFDVQRVRQDFPILSERVHGRQLVWLDNAATTQKPQQVIDRLAYFYSRENSNIHRGAHALAARATDAYEGARATAADFVGAQSADSVVFTRGTTEAINLVAQAWGCQHLAEGDEILISHLEHHANIVPWQQVAAQTGAVLKVIPVDDTGRLLLEDYQALLSDRTRIVAVAHVSNVLGTVVPIAEMAEAAHRAGACVLVDGAQAVAHLPVDVTAMDVDFYAFSGHKIFGPTGIGALYVRPEILQDMPPWQGGGNMISDVRFERTAYAEPPARFEAGTGNIADAAGLAAALDYVTELGLPAVAAYEHELLEYAIAELSAVPGLRLLGTSAEKASVLTFVLDGYQPDEVGSALDQQGIAVRAGHHCAQPILRRFGLEAAVRPSLAMYNTRAEVDMLAAALRRLAASQGRR